MVGFAARCRAPVLVIVGLMVAVGPAAPNVAAQETINYATLAGAVVDPDGAVVAGATVIARQVDTNTPPHRRPPIGRDASGLRIFGSVPTKSRSKHRAST
jgi:hypothetical protein